MKKICKGYNTAEVSRLKAKKEKTMSSAMAVSLMLIISIMGIWLVSMATITLVTAQEIYDKLYERSQSFIDDVENVVSFAYQSDRLDYLEYQMLRAIGTCSSASGSSGGYYDVSGNKERHKLIRDIKYPMETAVLFYDAEGNLIHGSESDVMYFDYYTQEEWDAGMDTTVGLHYSWIDMGEENDLYQSFRTMYADKGSLSEVGAICVTGYFEGTKLVPVVMHYVTKMQLQSIAESDDQFSTGSDSYSYITSDVDRTGKLEWQLQFDRSAEYNEKALTTVYLTYPEMWDYKSELLVYDEKEYENLAALTDAVNLSMKDSDDGENNICKLNELLIFGRSMSEEVATGEDNMDGYLVTAIRSNPLACAISALQNIYIVTGLLALALLLIVHNRIKKYLA